MPNSAKVGARPSISSTLWYSSIVSPCSATSAGVMVGSPGRGSGVRFTCLGMMEDLENIGHEAAERTVRFMNLSHQIDLALVDPDAVAGGTRVDFHILKITLDEVA